MKNNTEKMLDPEKKRKYRELLGVDEHADEESVKKAYRRLAMEYHPDRPNNKGKKEEAEQMFKQVTEAYEALQSSKNTINILKNSFKSTEIHSSLEHFLFSTGNLKMNSFSSVPCSDFTSSSSNISTPSSTSSSIGTSSFSNLPFNLGNLGNLGNLSANSSSTLNFTNVTKPKTTPRRGQSLQTSLKVGFEEGLYGCTKTIEFSRSLLCKICSGTGAKSSSSSSSTPATPIGSPNCRDCGGKGVLSAMIAGGSVTTACPSCLTNGLSKESTKGSLCSHCGGAGKTPTKKTCTVSVPPGVSSGMQQVFEGEGDEGVDGGQPGDLIVCFEVDNHAFYQRHGDDVYCKVPLPFPHAALGTKLEVPSIYGEKVTVTVDPGTQHKHVIKVGDEGFFNSTEGKRGDMYLQIVIEIPKALTEEEKKSLKKLALKDNFKSKFHSDLNNSVPPPF